MLFIHLRQAKRRFRINNERRKKKNQEASGNFSLFLFSTLQKLSCQWPRLHEHRLTELHWYHHKHTSGAVFIDFSLVFPLKTTTSRRNFLTTEHKGGACAAAERDDGRNCERAAVVYSRREIAAIETLNRGESRTARISRVILATAVSDDGLKKRGLLLCFPHIALFLLNPIRSC